jgi:ABC-type bacteriocin/lantibiotic exporter with double-glycine peptidase domain
MSKTVNPVMRIFNLVQLEKKEITAIYFYAILSGLIQLTLPLGVQAIVGFVLGGAMNASLALLISLVVLGVLATGMLQIGQMQQIEKIEQKIFIRNTYHISSKLPRLDLKQVDGYYLPELVNRYFEIPILQKGLSKLLLDIPLASIQILFGLILLSFYHPAFILFGLVLVTILWMILYYTGSKGLQSSLEESASKYSVAAWLQEVARLIQSFKFYKAPGIALHKADERSARYLRARNTHFQVLMFQFGILVAFKVLITAAMLIVGVMLLLDQQLNIGQFIAAEIIILMVITSVEKLIGNLESVYDVITSLDKIAKLTDKPLETEGSSILAAKEDGVSIETRDLSFGYHPLHPIIRDLSFRVESGEKICLTGKPGSGKSTLLRLISGSYPGFEGALMLDGLPIGNYQPASIRSQTSILLSKQDIFHGSLLENICMGNEDVDMDRLVYLSQELGLAQYLSTQQAGFDDILDPDGNRLPRNVTQKILLLRALINQPRLMLLEDPLSGLEEPYKSNLVRILREEYPRTTVIMSGNDPALLKCCDRAIDISKTDQATGQ